MFAHPCARLICLPDILWHQIKSNTVNIIPRFFNAYRARCVGERIFIGGRRKEGGEPRAFRVHTRKNLVLGVRHYWKMKKHCQLQEDFILKSASLHGGQVLFYEFYLARINLAGITEEAYS